MCRMSLQYVIEYCLIETVLQNIPKGNTLLVRYEDLAAYPDKKLEELARWLGVRYRRDATENFRARVNHGIAGNIIRHGTKGIHLDEKWSNDLGGLSRILVILLKYFLARKYGYF